MEDCLNAEFVNMMIGLMSAGIAGMFALVGYMGRTILALTKGQTEMAIHAASELKERIKEIENSHKNDCGAHND